MSRSETDIRGDKVKREPMWPAIVLTLGFVYFYQYHRMWGGKLVLAVCAIAFVMWFILWFDATFKETWRKK